MSESRSQATPARDLETQLREAIYKTGRGALENATEPNQKRVLQFLKAQGPAKLEEHLNTAGNSYVNLFLPAILSVINQHIEKNQ